MEENKLNLKPFDLEKAKAGKPVCTRDGRKARIVCFDRESKQTPIVALVEYHNRHDGECVTSYSVNGFYNDEPGDNDLMMLPEKHEGWVNIVKEPLGDDRVALGRIFKSREDAVESAKNNGRYVTTAKIEWEE